MEEIIELIYVQQKFESEELHHAIEEPTFETFFEMVEIVK